ncbi:hypothetical protein ACKWTF_000648 [Chironomus riparius]
MPDYNVFCHQSLFCKMLQPSQTNDLLVTLNYISNYSCYSLKPQTPPANNLVCQPVTDFHTQPAPQLPNKPVYQSNINPVAKPVTQSIIQSKILIAPMAKHAKVKDTSFPNHSKKIYYSYYSL